MLGIAAYHLLWFTTGHFAFACINLAASGLLLSSIVVLACLGAANRMTRAQGHVPPMEQRKVLRSMVAAVTYMSLIILANGLVGWMWRSRLMAFVEEHGNAVRASLDIESMEAAAGRLEAPLMITDRISGRPAFLSASVESGPAAVRLELSVPQPPIGHFIASHVWFYKARRLDGGGASGWRFRAISSLGE